MVRAAAGRARGGRGGGGLPVGLAGRGGRGGGDVRGAATCRAARRGDRPLLDLVRNFPLRKASRDVVTAWSRDALARCPLPVALRPAEGPGLHVAPVATGDVVVGSDAFKTVIRNKNRTLAAVEMEAGGAALSAYRSDTADVLVVRGISDHAAKDKTATDLTPDVDGRPNAWRRYAVTNATRIMLKLLAAPDFPWRGTSPVGGPVSPAPPRRLEPGPSRGDGAESGPAVDGRSPDGRRSGKGWLDGRTVAAVTSGAATALAVESFLHRRRDIEEAVAAASTPPAPDAGSHAARTESADGSDGSDGGSHPSADLHP
ncbi:phosphorylase family protein [Streptomyces cyaneofuscatus]|uniref:phosphorylase family protein n=1 Tax=Streptomyces cyaneofuscatus TaxID=66883 RepID=UPI0033B67BB7